MVTIIHKDDDINITLTLINNVGHYDNEDYVYSLKLYMDKRNVIIENKYFVSLNIKRFDDFKYLFLKLKKYNNEQDFKVLYEKETSLMNILSHEFYLRDECSNFLPIIYSDIRKEKIYKLLNI